MSNSKTTSPSVSRFRRYLSYIWEQEIQTTSSIFNPYLEVTMSRGRFRLNTENATYSFEDFYDNYFKSFKKYQISKRPLQKVLVLGLGLGSIPLMLIRRFNQYQAHFLGVEIDEVVINLCHQYFPEDLSNRLTTICEDAYEFVNQDNLEYDLIAVDVFLDNITPMKFRSKTFLSNLKRLLAPNAFLFYNTMTTSNAFYLQSHKFFEDRFQPVFQEAEVLQMESNRMFVFQKLQ